MLTSILHDLSVGHGGAALHVLLDLRLTLSKVRLHTAGLQSVWVCLKPGQHSAR